MKNNVNDIHEPTDEEILTFDETCWDMDKGWKPKKDFQGYMAQGDLAYCGTIQMDPSVTAQELQEAIDEWDFKTMKLTVVRFRDYGDPTWIPETRTTLNAVPFLRESTPQGIMYRVPAQGFWIPSRAKSIASASEDACCSKLYAGFKTEGGKPVPELRSDNDFFIHGGFSYDEAVRDHAFTVDGAADASDVLGIWDEVTGWVLPVVVDSVIVWRAFGEGRSNFLSIYDGFNWWFRQFIYQECYDDDPNDEPDILADIADREARLKRYVDLGIDPRTIWEQLKQQ